MRKNGNQSSPSLSVPPALQALLWIVAIGAPSFVLHTNGVQAAVRDAEQRVLTQVAQTIQSPSAARKDVFSVLARQEKEVTQARIFRVCTRLGMKPDDKSGWNAVFDDASLLGKEDQAKAARVIAEECGLNPNFNLKLERILLMVRTVAASDPEAVPTAYRDRPMMN